MRALILGDARAAEVVDYLGEKGIPDLYGNPLTLSLFGDVAAKSNDLPKSRADLLLRASEVMWNESNDRHDKSALAALDQDTALAAAGAVSAAFILTGSEAITLRPSDAGASQAIQVAQLRSLPGGEHSRTLIGSRLFAAIPGTTQQFKPIHRAVAEFLGARWLARTAEDDQMRERVLAMMTIDSGVPASLRGIHAWLAHDDRFAAAVISTDPYGVLRYGDADNLTVGQGRQLLQALKALQQANPYFRAEDWGSHRAKGLTHIELLHDIRTILLADDTTVDLRTLVLEVIKGSKLAIALSSELQNIMLNGGGRSFSFRERRAAAESMIDLNKGGVDWKALVGRLTEMGDEASTRLALEVMRDLEFEGYSGGEIASAILAHLRLNDDGEADHSADGTLFFVGGYIPTEKIAAVLDALAAQIPVGNPEAANDRGRFELSGFVARMIARVIEDASPAPLSLLGWLRIAPERHSYDDEDRERIGTFLQQPEIRHAIQHKVIFVESDYEHVWSRIWRLHEVNTALVLGRDDVIHFLALLAQIAEPTAQQVEIWQELTTCVPQTDERFSDILQAARPFARGSVELERHLEALEKPRQPAEWEIQRAAHHEERNAKRAEAWAQQRKDFAANEAHLRAGELGWVYPVSQVYLGLVTDVDLALPPADRIGQWLGSELQSVALVGLEAVLTRADIPTLYQIANSYAESRRWNFIYPLIAGLVQRLRDGRGLDDVPIDLVTAVQIALQNEHLGERIKSPDITKRLEVILRRDLATYERYVRLLIEPSLERRQSHITGLYGLVRSAPDRQLARRLSIEWLGRYSNLPVSIETELVDVLAECGDHALLRDFHGQQVERGFANDEHRRNWEAIGLLADFDAIAEKLGRIPEAERNLLWHIRHRVSGERGQDRPMQTMTAQAGAWIVRQFRSLWPNVERPSGVTSGDTNPWDASEFLRVLINRLAADTSGAAAAELAGLVAEPEDAYTLLLRYAVDQQRRARREVNFPGVTFDRLKDVVEARAPRTTEDLLVIIRHALARLQMELRGSDTDAIDKYWRDDGRPRDEDSCTDRLIEDIQRLLPPYGISCIPQRDMPRGKRADIVFTIGEAALPIECKGQWNPSLWSAAADQLDSLYLLDWRSQDRGIYLVYWFGPNVASMRQLVLERYPALAMKHDPNADGVRPGHSRTVYFDVPKALRIHPDVPRPKMSLQCWDSSAPSASVKIMLPGLARLAERLSSPRDLSDIGGYLRRAAGSLGRRLLSLRLMRSAPLKTFRS
jgi:hypothetical protein